MRPVLLLIAAACAVRVALGVSWHGKDIPKCSGKGVFHKFQHGDFRVTVLSDGYLEMQDNPFEPETAKVKAAYKKAQMRTDPFEFPQNIVVLQRGPHVVLVDAGSRRNGSTDALVENLKLAGIPPQSVTHILLTHGHFDHVGGLVDNGKAVYPNAKVYISKREFLYWRDEAKAKLRAAVRLAESSVSKKLVDIFNAWLKPYKDRRVLVEPNHVPLPGITYSSTPGHTFHHMAIIVRSREKTLFIAGDMVMGKASNLRHPDWVMKIESDGKQAVETRNDMLATLATTGFLTVLYHEAFPGVGTVVREGNSYNWKPSPESEAIVKRCRGVQVKKR